MSPSTGISFPLLYKYALALASLIVFVAIALLFEPERWFQYAAGAVFGALVLGPYAAARNRVARILALAIAGAGIYYLAVWFVAEGPLPYDVIVSLVVAGSGAALLCGLVVVVIGPHTVNWALVPLLLVAGALGGAAFKLRIPNDELMLVGHATWQLLVCVALHFGFRPGGLTSSSAS